MRLKFFHTSSSSSTRAATLTDTGVSEFQRQHRQQQSSSQYPVTEPRRGPRRNQARQHPSVMQMFDQPNESIPMQREHSAGSSSTSSSSYHSSQQQQQHLMPAGFEPTTKQRLPKQHSAQRPVIRFFHSFTSSSSSCSDTDDDELDEPQESIVVEPKKEIATALSPPPPHKHRPTPSKRDPTTNSKLQRVIQEENERLREQIGRLREDARRDRVNQQAALIAARREVKYLQRTLARMQRVQESQDESHTRQSRRRRSTGSSEHMPVLGMLNKSDMTVVSEKNNNSFLSHLRPAVPVEKKLSILLDEIEAMQLEEDTMQEKCDQLAHSNAELEQELQDRDETIRQLEHDLRVHSLRSKNLNSSSNSSPSGSITRA
ncbi:hypothetical protein BCR43DRAFT_496176 [Syncephalastrum racemosum]|uniref:Uncharacterized protein n=1 Tax=Syncephalastrum racemosum TaxID=13706 RepID=A0A1X2H3K1_SYNRA|nr:hypothetical protein BCR43DRAFT_496176 [Syncephalastrum racemosum]